jgi:two-component sensor histidine kinase
MLGTCLELHDCKREVIEAKANQAREHSEFENRIREVQHRIKNNLQIIIASLSIKRRDASADLKGISPKLSHVRRQ